VHALTCNLAPHVKWVPLMSNQAGHSKKQKSLAHPSYWEFLGHKIVTLFTTDFWVLLNVLFCCSDNVKVDPNHHQSIKRTNVCWEFKRILLLSESWVYSPFYPWDLILSIPMLSPPWLLCSYARFRSLPCCFHMALALREVTGRSRSLEGIGSRVFKPCFIT
jgi:hypothetical protein